ncbi:MAG: DUF3467 domain-containing protein [Rikenellaceae bacterium]
MADNKIQQPKSSIELKVSEEIAKGQYANLSVVSHSQMEFILDFAAILPGMTNPSVNSRIVMTPQHAKQLLKMLHENVERYETAFGQIAQPNNRLQPNDTANNVSFTSKLGDA